MHNATHTKWRNPSSLGTDALLTPPKLLAALGAFDMDPCCPPDMPWKTARRMVCEPRDGLACEWKGRVWLNPPYSDPLPWIERMAAHGRGVALLSAKSPETAWGQRMLATADALLFLKGRLLFWRPDGTETEGKWLPNVLAAYGKENVAALRRATKEYHGVLLGKVGK